MNTFQLNLSEDLDAVGRLDALTGIRDTLWEINPRNILRAVIEEVAGSPDDGDEDEFAFTKPNPQRTLEYSSISIEVVDGLNLAVEYAYNRSTRVFAAVVKSITLVVNNKTFVLNEKFALEQNVNAVEGSKDSTFGDFVDYHGRLAETNQGSDTHIDILIDLLFDFTPIESVW